MKEVRILYDIDLKNLLRIAESLNYNRETLLNVYGIELKVDFCDHWDSVERAGLAPYDFMIIHLGAVDRGNAYKRAEKAKKISKNPNILTVAESAVWNATNMIQGDEITRDHFDIVSEPIYTTTHMSPILDLLKRGGFIESKKP